MLLIRFFILSENVATLLAFLGSVARIKAFKSSANALIEPAFNLLKELSLRLL